jgi:DnaJ-class molecular chaperone
MTKKDKLPKIRRSWAINPKTRVTPNKKKNKEACPICDGTGTFCNAYGLPGRYAECQECGGTGYAT